MTPTFRNDNDFTVRVTNISGEAVAVLPNEIVKSYQDLTVDGFTKTSEVPGWSPDFNWSKNPIGVNASATITVGKRVTGIDILNRTASSGEIDVHFNDANNPRVAYLPPGADVSFGKDHVYGRVNSIIITSVLGACVDVRQKQE